MIDLHLHTTASDGRLSPTALVALAAKAGLRVVSVTDHDTVAGLPEARGAAGVHRVRLVDGIEMTAVDSGRDVHVLGYFFDPEDADLARFLHAQRLARIERVREIEASLAPAWAQSPESFPRAPSASIRRMPPVWNCSRPASGALNRASRSARRFWASSRMW